MAIATVFNVEARNPGKGQAKALRNERKVPAVIYGPNMENLNVVMDEIFVLKHSGSRFESSIFKTESDDKKLAGLQVMLKKIQVHPVSKRPEHVDLYALDMKAKIKVNVTINFIGEPVGVVDEGGALQTVLREIEIECNASDIPESIDVDISKLKLNESVHVSDVTFPAGVELITSGERTIATVAMPKVQAAETDETPAEAGDAATAESSENKPAAE